MRRTRKTKRFNAAHEVYERIVSALRSGVAPWKKPWVDGMAPMNVVTKRSYNGFNCFSLNLVCIEHGPSLLHGGDEAYYSPTKDIVCLPPMSQFKNAESYYGTLFHELVHSTGQKTRLDRDMNGVFGTPSYAFEELIAEIGSSVLCNDCGVCPDLGNSAAYCDSWLKCFADGTIKKKQMLSAFSKAWSAVKFIQRRC